MIQGRVSLLRYLLPRLEDAVFIALFVGVIGLGPRLLNVDGDLGRHLTVGGYILDSRRIPTQDIFSHTLAGEPLTPHEWLAQVSFTLAYRLRGLDGVVWFCALLIAGTFTLLFRHTVRRSGTRGIALGLVIVAAGAASLHWLARPHLFTLLMVVLWTDGLERVRQGEVAHWWRLPLLMLLWVNLHGAFIAGFVIWGAYGLGALWQLRWGSMDQSVPSRPGRYLLLVGAASALTTLFNPSGWHVWATSLGYISNRYLVGHTAEYLPPNFQQVSAWPFLALIVLSLFLLATVEARLPFSSTVLLAGWTAMALYSVRNVPLYALIATPILAEVAGSGMRTAASLVRWQRLDDGLAAVEKSLRGHVWPAVTAGLVMLLLVNGARLDFTRRGNRFDLAVFPAQAIDWLQANPVPGRMFNYFTWGGYILYRLWPEQQVFIDGQTDFYGEALTRQYEQVISLAAGWQDILRQFGVDWVLMPAGSDVVRALRADPAWQVMYQDQTAVILARVR